MDLLQSAREIDHAHPGERAIFLDALASEGLVLFSRDIAWSDVAERQLVAVVSGEGGPELVCARAWPSFVGDGQNVRIDLRCRVEDVCRRFMSEHSEPALERLTPHVDVGVIARYPGSSHAVWRSSTVGGEIQTIYLLRLPAAGGHDLAVVSDTVLGSRSDVVEHGRASTAALRAWAAETFGAPRPASAP